MNYKELADLVAKGCNFEENACVVGVTIDDGEYLNTTVYCTGNNLNIREIIHCLIEKYLDVTPNAEILDIERKALIETIKRVCEEKRF